MDDISAGLTRKVIGLAIRVHEALGPGLLESAYQKCLAHELHTAGLGFGMEVPLPITYRDVHLESGYRLDFVVEEQLLLELKSVESLQAIHEAQLMTYLKLSGLPLGLVINFNVTRLKNGIMRRAMTKI